MFKLNGKKKILNVGKAVNFICCRQLSFYFKKIWAYKCITNNCLKMTHYNQNFNTSSTNKKPFRLSEKKFICF